MRLGWRFAGEESLGMPFVTERDSPWHGVRPVPRMVQNQLNHLLELRLTELDTKILKKCKSLVEKRGRDKWMVLLLVFFFLLHVREVDTARNIYWRRYDDIVRPVEVPTVSQLTTLGRLLDTPL